MPIFSVFVWYIDEGLFLLYRFITDKYKRNHFLIRYTVPHNFAPFPRSTVKQYEFRKKIDFAEFVD